MLADRKVSLANARPRLPPPVLAGALTGLLLAAVFANPASAAVTPQASTECSGVVVRAPTPDQPNMVAYRFACNNEFKAYSVVVNRSIKDSETIDYFKDAADVYFAQAEYAEPTIVPTESFTCEGYLPGEGFNCNGDAKPWHVVTGTFSTTDPICGGTPTDAPKNSRVILPPAWVELIINNATTANSGPFRLYVSPKCPRIKPKPKPKKTCKKLGKGKQAHVVCTTKGKTKKGK
jgi:hypothetical protein